METEPQIIKRYVETGKVKIVYRHLLQLGDVTVRAAEASECAADQGRFWAMRALLYQRQDELYGTQDIDGLLARFASELSLNANTYAACMDARAHLGDVQADDSAAQKERVRGRPAFDINGQKLVGQLPFSAFQKAIETALGT